MGVHRILRFSLSRECRGIFIPVVVVVLGVCHKKPITV